MSETQNSNAQSNKVLLVVGSLCTLFGLFTYGQRQGFADFFLNAHFLFGIPLTEADAVKVVLITIGSVITILMGLTILGVGVIRSLKSSPTQSGSSQGSTATQTPR